ncbi:hypothetical protein FHR32_002282 [Streptosporangium album]|uniref:Uncharacterized protein n=1 Tax=Streptosporangium album TaxID=47479 RepID=A0A7W7W856_9ACTN|nr:hypothetical protein [Streptosporangium album]MBB4937977.1 hypothetical protein [Streptosporangium album]
MKASAALAARLSTAAAIAVSGYIHADLYLNGGYRHIHIIGIFGFTEHGFTPSPQAAISVIVEVAALLLLAAWQPAMRKPAEGLTGAE